MINKSKDARNKNQESRLKHFTFHFLIILSGLLILQSCGGDDDDDIIAPKPRAYFRLSFPEKKYVNYDSACPFTFQMPVYAKIENDKNPMAEACWLNMNFSSFNGTLHLTYKSVNNKNLKKHIEDSYTLSSKHHVKASGIKEQVVMRDSSKVYGLIYDIEGNTATSFQFFVTDSTSHFMHGALYFNAVPNIDSISPVIAFLKKDIYNVINTLEWKNTTALPKTLK